MGFDEKMFKLKSVAWIGEPAFHSVPYVKQINVRSHQDR